MPHLGSYQGVVVVGPPTTHVLPEKPSRRKLTTNRRVSRAGRTFWTHDASTGPDGPRRARHGPGGYCRPSGIQGVQSPLSTALTRDRIDETAKDQAERFERPSRGKVSREDWRGQRRPEEGSPEAAPLQGPIPWRGVNANPSARPPRPCGDASLRSNRRRAHMASAAAAE